MRAAARLATLALVALAVSACGSSDASLGPLTITPPEGWYVTDREAQTIKITNGTIADENSTETGTATAVFDVFIESTQTPDEFSKTLRENNVDPKIETLEIGGYNAVLVAYPTSYFGPSTEVVFLPDWDVRIIYRAAFPNDEAAFARHRGAFREALRTITFRGRPRDRAVGVRGRIAQ